MRKAIDELALRGTTTVGAVGNDGVTLDSDTGATLGSLIVHKGGKKVYNTEGHLAMTISGAIADAQRTVEMLKANSRIYRLERQSPKPLNVVARLISNLFFSYRLFAFAAQESRAREAKG